VTWFDNLGKMAKSAVDFTGVPGLFKDLATSGSNDDPWYVDGVNFVKNTVKVATTPVRAAVGGLLAAGQASYELGGKVRREGVETILEQPFMYNKFKAPGESYTDYTLRVEREKENISLMQAGLSVLSPGRTSGDRSGWFQNWTDNNFKFLSAGFDVFNQEDRDTAFRDQYTGKFLSGIGDLVASTIIDPLTFAGFLGKGAVIAAKAPMLDQIQGKTARAVFGKFAMTEEKLDNILIQALDGKGEALADIDFLATSTAREQYKYWKKKKVTNPDAMAYLFGRAGSQEEVIDTFRAVMYRDTKAISKISAKDEETALMMDALNDVPHPHRQFLEGKTDGDLITSPEYNRTTGGYISKLIDETSDSYDQRFATALAEVRTGGQLKYGFSRGPWEGKLAAKSKKEAQATFAEADSITFQKTSLHPIIKVVNFFTKELPSGVFNVHNGDSYIEFNAFLREANELSKGRFGAQAAGFADRYLAAVSTGERNAIIQQAEKAALSTLFPNYSADNINKLYAIFDYRRASRIKQHRDQGFVSYMENGQVVNAIAPVLQRESANIVIIADLRKLKYAIDSHERVLPGILDGLGVEDLTLRTQKGLSALSTINDIFKTSVLMRLGYTVRNITEAQLSMLAKGFALPAMVAAGGPEAVRRFFNNRKVGFNRLIDQVNVATGKVDDIRALEYAFQSEVDKLRAIDMSRKQLAKAVSTRIRDIENDTFRLRLGPSTGVGVGPLTVEDELRTLRGVLADLESVTLYHGSPEAAFKLDEARVLATSASPSVAARYSTGFTIHSTENYLETPSGRPGRLGQKPELTPGAEIGSFGVVEKMPKEEFDALTRYVSKDFTARTSIQNILRGFPVGSLAEKYAKEFPVAQLKRAIQRSVITKNTTVYRGTRNPDILNAKLGDIITEKGFISTSKEYKGAEQFAGKFDSAGNPKDIIVTIELPKGTRGIDVNSTYSGFNDLNTYESENEVLLAAGTKFKVIKLIPGQPATADFPAINPIITLQAIPDKKPGFNIERVSKAADNLLTDMIAAKNAGKEVEMKTARGWRKVESLDWNQIRLAEEGALEVTPDLFIRSVFRVKGTMNKPVPVRVYGDALYLTKWSDVPVELRDIAFGGKAANYKEWTRSKGWQNPDDPVTKYMRENGFGRAVVQDDKLAGGVSNIVLPEAIDNAGRKRSVERSIAKMEERAATQIAEDLPDIPGLEQQMATPKQRRLARTAARKAARRAETPVSPYYTKENVNAMINNGVEDAAENLAKLYTMSHAYLDDISSRLNARISMAETNAIKQRTGYGYLDIEANDNKYTVPNTFQDATWFMGNTSAESTWNAMIGSQEMAFSVGIGARTVSKLKSNDPKYFEGWSNILNLHFRDPETGIMDPMVRRILDGETDQDILNWLTRSKDGRLYANDTYTTPAERYGLTALRGGELNEDLLEKINITRGAVKLYIPDEETALFLSTVRPDGRPISGAELQNYLRDKFGSNPENLPDINGLLVTTSKEYRDQERLIDTFNRRVMRFLGSLPEDAFTRHPLASAIYNRQIRINIQNIADAKGTDKLTAEEINAAIRGAREDARRTVEQTLFTIVRRTRASSSQIMQLMFPFYVAYENTIKRWSGIIAENPQAVTTAARTIAQLVNGQTIIDRDGNRITDAKDLAGDNYANLVIQVPQGFIDSLPSTWQDIANNAFKSVNIPLSSLDVITQGQPGNPGFGPYAVLPTYLILRNRPELEEAFKPFFPAGMPQSAVDLFAPAAFRRLRSMYSQDELYVRTFNQMLRYEAYNYNSGRRTDEPTLDEITDKTNKFFMLRALSSLTMPFAISPEMDFYQQTFRQFLNQYGPGEAEAKFLEMYPDYFEATVSLSKSPGSLESNMATVKNLKKFRGLMAEAESSDNPELIGFLANDFDGQYTFSQAAYQWQYRQGAYPGSKNTYRQNRSPEELLRDANIKRGWTEFNSLMGQINTYKIQNGIVADNDPRMDIINGAKQLWVRSQAESNFDWYSEYISPDRGKYERRAIVLKKALSDKDWMSQNGERPVVKAMAVYLDLRDQMASLLKQRDRAGGSQTLSAKSNADLAYAFEQVRQQLIAESPEFEQFLNRYFINDTVVV
jgi:hypothetical protein